MRESLFNRSRKHSRKKAEVLFRNAEALFFPESRMLRLLRLIVALLALSCLVLVLNVPLGPAGQLVFFSLTLLIVLVLRKKAGHMVSLLLMGLSLAISARYLYWRLTESIAFQSYLDMFFGYALVGAEIYAVVILALGYFQSAWPLKRKPVPLPPDTSLWPTVDVFIPTYNEPLKVVIPTILAAKNLDWPSKKINIYVLDDGRRDEFREFCNEVNVGYLRREDNAHAKAGNINRALTKTHGQLIAIFDCDHIPTRSFLQLTAGGFLQDPKLALVQTPHHFFSPDPFERNLRTFRKIPNEGELFYGLIQDGNDLWNSTFFCGSCAVIKRAPLEEIGGIAVETVTEDAHTALRLHMLGYNSSYMHVIQAAGLATESLSGHVGQRIRWARGMTQVFRTDNPIFGKGLRWYQRLCYTNAMLHFFFGLPRLIFLTAPLSYLFFGAHIINATAIQVASYALPHLIMAAITNSRLQGQYRHSFWAEVYETVLSVYILIPTTMALINPKLGSFNVTAKGGLVEKSYFDRKIAKPYLFMLLLNIVGLAFGILRFYWWNTYEIDSVILNITWTIYNLIIISAATAVAREREQRRVYARIPIRLQVMVRLPDGRTITCRSQDLSEGGGRFTLPADYEISPGDSITLSLFNDMEEVVFPSRVIRIQGHELQLEFEELDLDQKQQLVGLLYGRADTWVHWRENREDDKPLRSLKEILLSSAGVLSMLEPMQHLKKRFKRTRRATSSSASSVKTSTNAMTALLVLLALLFSAQPARSATARETLTRSTVEKTMTLKMLGAQDPMRIEGIRGERLINFSIRRDEVVVKARLELRFAYSPALLEDLSHLNVIVNDEVVHSLPLGGGKNVNQVLTLPLDPVFINGYNKLRFQLIGHYTLDCEDPAHSSLWLVISNKSKLVLTLRRINLENDLANLPVPFFDSRDSDRLKLAFAFSETPGHELLKSAGMVGSWFGALAGYRGARFSAHMGDLPEGNTIVFATNQNKPEWLSLPRLEGGTLILADHPRNSKARVLVIAGRDAGEVELASLALTLGEKTFAGKRMTFFDGEVPPRRAAYDAPRWIPTNRPVKFGEIAPLQTLQSHGFQAEPIVLRYNVPPDLWTWRSDGAELDLTFRHVQLEEDNRSTLNISINGGFLESYRLADTSDSILSSIFSLGDKPGVERREHITIPPSHIAAQNTLQFHFFNAYKKEGPCKDIQLDNLYSSIDPDSTLDYSTMPHFAALPNLAYFANMGFPYTKYADLAETAVILPDNFNEAEAAAFLTIMGRMGHATGYPATRMKVIRPGQAQDHADYDLILIGGIYDQPLFKQWREALPMDFTAPDRLVRVPTAVEQFRELLTGRIMDKQRQRAGNLLYGGAMDMAILAGFESPLQSGRSVIAVTVDRNSVEKTLTDALLKPDRVAMLQGDFALIRDSGISSFVLSEKYHTGHLPWYRWLQWRLSQTPLLLIPLVFFGVLILAVWCYYGLKRRAARRKGERQAKSA